MYQKGEGGREKVSVISIIVNYGIGKAMGGDNRIRDQNYEGYLLITPHVS